MKVILKQDVKKVGKRGDIVDVSDGYGRNFLIARGLAVAESKASLEILKEQKSEEAALEAQREQEAREKAALLEKTVITFTVKSGKEGRVFGSVSTINVRMMKIETLSSVSAVAFAVSCFIFFVSRRSESERLFTSSLR